MTGANEPGHAGDQDRALGARFAMVRVWVDPPRPGLMVRVCLPPFSVSQG
jgi:hypothetical protein